MLTVSPRSGRSEAVCTSLRRGTILGGTSLPATLLDRPRRDWPLGCMRSWECGYWTGLVLLLPITGCSGKTEQNDAPLVAAGGSSAGNGTSGSSGVPGASGSAQDAARDSWGYRQTGTQDAELGCVYVNDLNPALGMGSVWDGAPLRAGAGLVEATCDSRGLTGVDLLDPIYEYASQPDGSLVCRPLVGARALRIVRADDSRVVLRVSKDVAVPLADGFVLKMRTVPG